MDSGIAPYNGGLIIASSMGGIYFLDLEDNDGVNEIVPDGTAIGADGIAIADGDILYVVENSSDRITAWQLAVVDGVATAESVGMIESEAYNFISTC
jgi:sugar lactone lactonase YvrE